MTSEQDERKCAADCVVLGLEAMRDGDNKSSAFYFREAARSFEEIDRKSKNKLKNANSIASEGVKN